MSTVLTSTAGVCGFQGTINLVDYRGGFGNRCPWFPTEETAVRYFIIIIESVSHVIFIS